MSFCYDSKASQGQGKDVHTYTHTRVCQGHISKLKTLEKTNSVAAMMSFDSSTQPTNRFLYTSSLFSPQMRRDPEGFPWWSSG